jgi:hypothetical protein
MPISMTNKHGFTGVRKRTDYAWRRRPYYARISNGCDIFIYSKNVATAEEAAAEYERLKAERQSARLAASASA